jgi:CBS domain-containing protein
MMKVADLMTRHVEFIDADSLVKDAAVMMGELDVGGLPVGGPERIEGVVTDRDILYRVVARGLDCAIVRVRDVLSRPIVACREDDTLRAAMDMMAANHIRRMPVRNGDGIVSGWITLSDLSRRMLVDSAALQAALRDLTEPG